MQTLTLEETALGKTLFEVLQEDGSGSVQAELWQQWHEIHATTSAGLQDGCDDPRASHDALLTVMLALDRARSILNAAANLGPAARR